MPNKSTKSVFPNFISQLSGYSKTDKERLLKAYYFAREHHHGQKRQSGEAYIIHPIAVVQILAGWGVDIETLLAGMLHDTIEDTTASRHQVALIFGESVASLVEGVTKIGNLRIQSNVRAERSTENIRKLLIAMSRDIRVIIVKLADRLHNMRTIKYIPEVKRLRIAQETLDVFAPIADRLAMGEVKAELEDLAFAVVLPKRAKELHRIADPKIRAGKKFLATVSEQLEADCQEAGINPVIENRVKHLYSLHKKLAKYEEDFNKIRDLVAVRVIVDDISQCYQVMGLVHNRYKPLPQYIKDYIAVPKPNGYQSLHTTVLGERHIFEVQIRTKVMHEFAEHGMAAHFYYDQNKASNNYKNNHSIAVPKKLEWVQNLLDWQDTSTSSKEAKEGFQLDVFNQRIFVFSPLGDLYDLPEGSTPIDFAFQVHTNLGLTCRGAKVNGAIVTLDQPLQNRDVVEIFSFNAEPKPSRDWLSFVVTTKARNRIKAWFKAQDLSSEEQTGRKMLDEALSKQSGRPWHQIGPRVRQATLEKLGLENENQLFKEISQGRIRSADVVRELIYDSPRPMRQRLTAILKARRQARPVALIPGIDRDQVSRAGCCSPRYPEKIVGYIPRNGGCRVHQSGCSQIENQLDRQVPAYWYFESSDRIKVIGHSQQTATILKAISHHLHGFDARARKIVESESDSDIQFDIWLSLVRMDRLTSLIRALHRIPGVERVEHIVQG